MYDRVNARGNIEFISGGELQNEDFKADGKPSHLSAGV